LALVDSTSFMLIAVVVDKTTHGKKTYRHVKHPYHYGLHALLERYCGWLGLRRERGDVMAEARGKREDRAVKEAYQEAHQCGTAYLDSSDCQRTVTSRELKLKPKHQNIAGLQLADLLANPVTRDVLVAHRRLADRGGSFADRLCGVIAKKYKLSNLLWLCEGLRARVARLKMEKGRLPGPSMLALLGPSTS